MKTNAQLIGIAYTKTPFDEDIRRMRKLIFTDEDMELLSKIKPEAGYN